MKNTVVAYLVVFFMLTAMTAFAAWFYLSLEYDRYDFAIKSYTKSKVWDGDKFVEKQGEQFRTLKANTYWEAEKDALTAQRKTAEDGLAKSIDAHSREAQKHKEYKKKRNDAMLLFHKPTDENDPGDVKILNTLNFEDLQAESHIYKFTKEFNTGYDANVVKVKENNTSRKGHRAKLVSLENQRRSEHNMYRQAKTELVEEIMSVAAEKKISVRQKAYWSAQFKYVMDRESKKKKWAIEGSIRAVGGIENVCSINKGVRHGIRPHQRFTVFRYDRKKNPVIMGKILVVQVHETTSQCTILPYELEMPLCDQCGWSATAVDMMFCIYCFDSDGSVTTAHKLIGVRDRVLVKKRDPFNPIVVGDYIYSPSFDSRTDLRFYVGTDTPFRSREEISKFIIENGGMVANSMDNKVDFFVPGSDKKSDEMIKEARRHGVRIMTTREVYVWFGKPKEQ